MQAIYRDNFKISQKNYAQFSVLYAFCTPNFTCFAHYICMNRKFTAICAALLLLVALSLQFAMRSAISTFTFALADDQPKCIYLTFDDGPSDRVTPVILDILKEEGVKATFFIVGERAETRKYLIKRESDEGHTVAVHSYSHRYSDIYASRESIIDDIIKCNRLIYEVTGNFSTLYRFPGGSFFAGDRLKEAVTEKGFCYVDWNASFRDAEFVNPQPQQLVEAAIETAAGQNRVVMLAHDSTDKSATAAALRDVIAYFKKNGYEFRQF